MSKITASHYFQQAPFSRCYLNVYLLGFSLLEVGMKSYITTLFFLLYISYLDILNITTSKGGILKISNWCCFIIFLYYFLNRKHR